MPTEWEKMIAGEFYHALDPELSALRRRARDLTRELNASSDAEGEGEGEGEGERRERLLRALIPHAGEGLWIEPPFFCDYGRNITMGERVFLNFNCVILDVAPVRLGDYAQLGPGVHIYTATHPFSAEQRRAGLEYGKPVELGADVWIGGGAIICPGVKVGSRSVIGAGSVVTRDVPEGVLAAGNPCRVIRQLTDDTRHKERS